jgi:biofilm PGA synthesis N-glycosyltransferase PgaC
MYIPVKVKFSIALTCAIFWTGASIYISHEWQHQLAEHIGMLLASIVILGVAIIPGFMNAFLFASLLMDHRPKRVKLNAYPAVSILIAAYNEEARIIETLNGIYLQHYSGPLEVIVINDGSTDSTASLLHNNQANFPWLKIINLSVNGGKSEALNFGFAQSCHSLVITLDADSYLYTDSLQGIVERYMEDPKNTRAVAGTVLVRNSRDSWITKAQEWDYFHGISAIKRVQSLYQGTLVAQGAFSIYSRDTLIEVGGWPKSVGEDIVLTWAILNAGYRIGHSEDACAFTEVPATLLQFSRQRQRWSRGVIEAFKHYPRVLIQPRLSTMFIYWNLLFPFLDMIFTLSFIPGLVLALFGYFWIAGPMTLALIPIAMAINYLMFIVGRGMFQTRRLHVRVNYQGFIIYSLFYNLIMQPTCFFGYLSEIFKFKKSWGTK